MITYQDLLAVGEDEKERMDFVRKVIAEHRNSELYRTADIADQYFRHRNVTITEYQKILYTVTGKAVPDNWSANYKMASRYFKRFITQENQYLLGNGVTWKNEETKDRLGNESYPFDNQLQKAGKLALIMGVAYGFYNADHVEVFSALEFAPLMDEENGSLCAGVRFWQIAPDKPLRATLYEMDGYTDYIWRKNKEGEILHQKRYYVLRTRYTEADGVEIYDAENYPSFPIVPLWGNPERQSEIVGLREQIDCYDLIKSGFANTVDEASIVYWTITNAGGMDDIDLAKFVQRLKTVHAATTENQEQTQSHSLDVPYASREALLERLEKDLYKDAMALNTGNIASGTVSTTATQIRAAYEPLNAKTDEYEYCVIDFIKGILAVAGIDDDPTFTRSMIVNVQEEVQNVLQAANYLDAEYVTTKILTIMGDGDKAEEVLKAMQREEVERYGYEDEGSGGGEDRTTSEETGEGNSEGVRDRFN